MFLLNQVDNSLRLTWQDEIIMDYNFQSEGMPVWSISIRWKVIVHDDFILPR